MGFTRIRSWWEARTYWERMALVLWSAVLLFVSVRALNRPTERTVYPIFSGSAKLWWSGADLYEPDRPANFQSGYRYSPTFAILLTPFAWLPDAIGGVLWRLVSTATLIASLAWLASCVLPWPLSRDQFAWLTLLCLPLTVQSLSNGQANVIVIASMVAAVAAVKQQRWNLACALMTLAFVCKVYPMALGMLLVVLYPRQLIWRMPLAVAVSLLAPFLLQETPYVLDQYAKWITVLLTDDKTTVEPRSRHRDLWLLIDLYGLPITRQFYLYLQLLGGIGIAALVWLRQRNDWPEQKLLTSTLALAVTWMLLLGPVVESSTFVLLAPAFACSMLAALQDRTWSWRMLLLVGSVILMLLAVLLGGIGNTATLNVSGLHPWASLSYFAFLLTEPRLGRQQAQLQTMNHRAAA